MAQLSKTQIALLKKFEDRDGTLYMRGTGAAFFSPMETIHRGTLKALTGRGLVALKFTEIGIFDLSLSDEGRTYLKLEEAA